MQTIVATFRDRSFRYYFLSETVNGWGSSSGRYMGLKALERGTAETWLTPMELLDHLLRGNIDDQGHDEQDHPHHEQGRPMVRSFTHLA